MEFRLAQAEDKPRIQELWQYSFEEEGPYFDWYFKEVYQPSSTLCCWDGDRIMAALQLAPYEISLRSSPLQANFIVGLSTDPGARGRGYGKALVQEALQLLARNHSPLCLLKPLAPAFYRKLGFDYCYSQLYWRLPMEKLAVAGAPYGTWREADIERDIPLLNQVYQAMTCGYHAFTLRKEEDWRKLLYEHASEKGKIWLMEDEGQPLAYLLFAMDKEKRIFEAGELAYADAESQRSAFAFAAGHSTQLDTFIWASAPADAAFLELTPEQGVPCAPSIMGRLVSVSETLAAISYPPGSAALIMEIKDAAAPWNNRVWKLQTEGLQGKISPAKEGEEPEVSMDINTLTMMVFGYLNPWQLAKSGRLEGSPQAVSRLERIFPPCHNLISQIT